MEKNNFLERITLKVKEQIEREKKQWPIESLEEVFKKDRRLPSFKDAFLKNNYPCYQLNKLDVFSLIMI